MARISRNNPNMNGIGQNRWSTALYLRLSREDGDKLESDSIDNQRSMLTRFIQENSNEFALFDVYVDDGYTGTNFNRPDFERMINDMKARLINCIIVKDLSRLGRDYIEMGNYQEKIFPEYNTRFIAINDRVDTLNYEQSDSLIVPFKNLINQKYAEDISFKVRSTLSTKCKNGEYIGSFAPYGYQKDPKDHHQLIIDPEAALVVKKIFSLFNSGMAKMTIAYRLNDENIPCPSEYKKRKGLAYRNPKQLPKTVYWTHSSINSILNNQMYTGDLVQHTQGKDSYKSKKNKKKDRSEWIIVPDTHEPIIDRETWDSAQALLQNDTKRSQYSGEVHLFAGLVYCADCGRAMVKRISYYGKDKSKRYYWLVCSTYKYYGKKYCSSHGIKYEEFESIILEDLKSQIAKHLNKDKVLNDESVILSANQYINQSRSQLNALQHKISQLQTRKDGLYDDYKEELIDKQEYLRLKSQYQKDIERYECESIKLKKTIEQSDSEDEQHNKWVDMLSEYADLEKLTRELVVNTIDKIIIHQKEDGTGNWIQINYKFGRK